MRRLMDLVAGDAREILTVIGTDDIAALDDRRRFRAHLALGGGLDPTWLDLFSEAARTVTGQDDPTDLLDARLDLGAPEDAGPDRTIERNRVSSSARRIDVEGARRVGSSMDPP